MREERAGGHGALQQHHPLGVRMQSLGFGVEGLGFRVEGLGFEFESLWFRV